MRARGRERKKTEKNDKKPAKGRGLYWYVTSWVGIYQHIPWSWIVRHLLHLVIVALLFTAWDLTHGRLGAKGVAWLLLLEAAACACTAPAVGA